MVGGVNFKLTNMAKVVKSAGGTSLVNGVFCDVFFVKVNFGRIKQLHYFPSSLKLTSLEVTDILKDTLANLDRDTTAKTKTFNHI